MAHLRNSRSGWRRVSTANMTTAEDVTRQAKAYIAWLCLDRGWYTESKPCGHCYGSGRSYEDKPPELSRYDNGRSRRALKRWQVLRQREGRPPFLTEDDKVTCPHCEGSRCEPLGERIYDTARAEAYLRDQRDDLGALAQAGVDGIKHRLFWHGFRPVVTGCHLPVGSIADYDRREAVRAGVAATLDDAWERAAAIRAELEAVYSAASGDDKIAILNDYNSESAVRIADRHCEEVRRQLWAFGNVHESLWAIPGTTETIHIGTKGQRRGYGYVKATHSIIIEPGRSPGAYEMDMIAEEAIAAIAPPVMLLAA